MSFEWFVARRYLIARRRQALISLISFVSILGVTVGVMALIIWIALIAGVQSELRDRIVGSTVHLQAYTTPAVTDGPAEMQQLAPETVVIGVSPAILGY